MAQTCQGFRPELPGAISTNQNYPDLSGTTYGCNACGAQLRPNALAGHVAAFRPFGGGWLVWSHLVSQDGINFWWKLVPVKQ